MIGASETSERDPLMCPSCFKNHRAWSSGAVCFFCGSKGRPASEVVGADWRSVKNHHVTPDEDCPHFEICSENACPLHPNYLKFEEDRRANKEPFKCRLRRATREQVASRWHGVLPNGGLTSREKIRDIRGARGRARWNALSEEEKAKRIGKLAELRRKKGSKAASSAVELPVAERDADHVPDAALPEDPHDNTRRGQSE